MSEPATEYELELLVPATRPAKWLEREVTRQVRDFLKHHGWRALRWQRTVIRGQFQTGEPGIPDFLFLHRITAKPGLSAELWIEVKRPGGRLSARQIEWGNRERIRGACVWVVEDFREFAKAYAREFGWLHDGRLAGQIELVFEGEPR